MPSTRPGSRPRRGPKFSRKSEKISTEVAERGAVRVIVEAALKHGPYSPQVMGLTLTAHAAKYGLESADRVWKKCRPHFREYGFEDRPPSARLDSSGGAR